MSAAANEAVETAARLLEEGLPLDAIERLKGASDDDPRVPLITCLAYVDLGHAQSAHAALAAAEALCPPDDRVPGNLVGTVVGPTDRKRN